MKSGYLALGAALVCSMASFAWGGDDAFINWRTDYRAALDEARQTRKPVFLEFRCEA